LTLLAVGRLVEQKRMDRFIGMLARLRDQWHEPVKGLIVGDGPLRSSLESQAQGLGLGQNELEFRGIVSGMSDVYQEADIFVLTSDWEGTPNVVLEAMASALPVVSTNVGGVSDLLTHKETGFIVEPKDEAQMLDHLLQLVKDPELRRSTGQNARSEVNRRFGFQSLPSNLEALYTAAMG